MDEIINTRAIKILSSAQITLNKVYDGKDGFTIELSNSNHSIMCDKNGTPLAGELGSSGKAICSVSVTSNSSLTAVNTTPGSGQYSIAISQVIGCTAIKKDASTFYIDTVTTGMTGKVIIAVNIENKQTINKEMSFIRLISSKNDLLTNGDFLYGKEYWTSSQNGTGNLPSTCKIIKSSEAKYGENILEATGDKWVYSKETINVEPNKIYRIKARLRQTLDPTTGGKKHYIGYTPFDSSNAPIGTSGAGNNYLIYNDLAMNTWTEHTFYVSQIARDSIIDINNQVLFPAVTAFPPGTVKFIPMFIVNYSAGNGIAEIDGMILEDATEDFQMAELKKKAVKLETDVNGINASVSTIKTITDMSNNPMTLVAKVNYSAFNTVNDGEFYLHGLDTNRNPADVDGTCMWLGQKTALPKTMFNPNGKVPEETVIYIVRNKADNKWWSVWNKDGWKKILADQSSATQVTTATWNETNDIVVGYYITKKSATGTDSETPIIVVQLFDGALNYKQATSMSLTSSLTQLKLLEDEMELKVAKDKVVASINLFTQTDENGTSSGIKIKADKINLDGAVTFSMLSSNKTNGGLAHLFNRESNTTTIKGGEIATGSITAEKIALGDFTNYAELYATTTSSSRWGWTIVQDPDAPNNAWLQKNGISRDMQISKWYECNGGESLRIKAEISTSVYGQSSSSNTTSVARPVGVMIFTKAADGTRGYYCSSRITAGENNATTTGKVNWTLQLPSTIRQFAVYIQIDGYPNFTGTLKVRDVLVTKMSSAELIVDGSISAEKIAVGAITAEKITVGEGAAEKGNLARGKTFTGGGGVTGSSAVPGDGSKTIGATHFGFGSGNSNNNSPERDYVQIDLGKTYRISESKVFFFSGDSRAYYYKIKYSTDNINWYYAVGTNSNSGWGISSLPASTLAGTVNPTRDVFAIPITARYLRLYGNGNTINTGNHLYEWEIYSKANTQITGNEITTGIIKAISGGSYLNLDNGSMLLGDTSGSSYLQWTGSALNIKASSISIGTSAVATDSTVNDKINNIQIGGRNLATKSNTLIKGVGAGGISCVQNSDGSITVTSTHGNGNWFTGFYGGDHELIESSFKEGDKFTISFTMKSSNTATPPSIYIKQGMGYYGMTGSLSSEYSTVYYSGVWKKANGINLHLGFGGTIGTITIKNIKIEKGNKATDWSPAPDDIESDINSVDSKVTTTNNKVSSIESTVSGITSKVTSLESTTSTINGNITNLQQRMSTAESKITSNAIINTVSSTINAAKQEAINSANSSTDSKLKNYATISSVTQTVDSWVAKFSSSGGSNMLKNGGFKRADRYGWADIEHSAGGTNKSRDVWTNRSYVPSGKSVLVLMGTNTVGEYGVQQNVKVKVNTKYTLSFYVSQHRCPRVGFVVRHSDSTWLTSGSFNDIPMATGDETGNGYVKKTVTFNSGSNTTVGIELTIFDSDDNGHAWFYDIMLNEGEIAFPWSPHHSETYEGSTQIDASGITVTSGAIRIKNNSGQEVLRGGSDGNLILNNITANNASIQGSITVSSHQHQIFRVDTADTKFPHMVIDSYGPYMDSLMITTDYAGYVMQKAVDGVEIRNNAITIYGHGQTFFTQGNVTIGGNMNLNGLIMERVWKQGQANTLRLNSGKGIIDIGCQNTSWAHFETDRPNFYFYKPIFIGSTSQNGAILGSEDTTGWKCAMFQRYGAKALYGIGSDGASGNQNYPAIECWNAGSTGFNARLDIKSSVLKYWTNGGPAFHCWVDTNNHGGISVGTSSSGFLKWLRTHSDLQCRNYDDTAYTRICASVFVVNSQKKAKENIQCFDQNTALNILMQNNIKHYNLISERKELEQVDGEAVNKGIELDYEMVTPDNHLGLVIEELTNEALDILLPSRSEGIDVYSMCSILWSACQKMNTENQELKNKIKIIEEKLGILS